MLIAIVLAGTRIHAELDQADALSVLDTQAPFLRDITQLVDSVSIKDGENFAAVRAATADLQQQADAAMLPPDTAAQLDTALGHLAGLGTNPASPDPVSRPLPALKRHGFESRGLPFLVAVSQFDDSVEYSLDDVRSHASATERLIAATEHALAQLPDSAIRRG